VSDRLNLPSILVLNSCGISHAGDESEIAAFCSHVSELDLSGNKLENWQEVRQVIVCIMLNCLLRTVTKKCNGVVLESCPNCWDPNRAC
ncbi:Ubiquitin-like domain, partial [Pristimantis euphronides]